MSFKPKTLDEAYEEIYKEIEKLKFLKKAKGEDLASLAMMMGFTVRNPEPAKGTITHSLLEKDAILSNNSKIKCECGSEAAGTGGHSNWCPKAKT